MVPIDVRTGPDTPLDPVDPRDFAAAHSIRAIHIDSALVRTLPPPLTLAIDRYTFNLDNRDGELTLTEGAAGAAAGGLHRNLPGHAS